MERVLKSFEGHEKIDKQLIQKIEEQYNIGINFKKVIRGKPIETIYESSRSPKVEINMRGKKFSLKSMEASKWQSLTPLKNKFETTKYFATFDPITNIVFSEKTGIMKMSEIDQTKYMLFESEEGCLEKDYHERKKGVEEICEMFGIDVDRTFYHECMIARIIAYEKFKYIIGAEHVEDEELEIIDGSTRGALQYAEKCEVTDCYEFDINSMYPALLSKSGFKFPLTRPKKRANKDHVEDENNLEIHKLKIKGSHKYFLRTPDDYYNTYQIRLLDSLGINYEKVFDYHYVYENCMDSRKIFGYMRDLYKLKQNGNVMAKKVMNSTWGILAKKNDFQIPIKYYDPCKHFDRVKQIRIDKGYVILENNGRTYRHMTARLKSFLLSFARMFMVQLIILPLDEEGFNVFQINTDGFITDANEATMNKIFEVGKKMGELKSKQLKGVYKISHVRKIEEVEDTDIFDD